MENEIKIAETIVERRKYPRYPLKLRVSYQLSDKSGTRSFLSQSISRDLGIGGMAMMLEECLEPGQVLSVQIGVPIKEAREALSKPGQVLPIDRFIEITARVVWRQLYDEKRYISGLQFLDLEQDATRALKTFLKEYEMQDGNIDEEE